MIVITDGVTKETSQHTCVKGFVEAVRYKEFEYEKQIIRQFQLSFINPTSKDRILFDIGFSVLGRTLMNSLLSVTDFSKVPYEVSVFNNKAGYAGVSLQTPDNRVDWKFTRDDVPACPKVNVNGMDMTDFTALNEFYLKHMEKWATEVKFFEKPTTADVAEEVFAEGFPSAEDVAPTPTKAKKEKSMIAVDEDGIPSFD